MVQDNTGYSNQVIATPDISERSRLEVAALTERIHTLETVLNRIKSSPAVDGGLLEDLNVTDTLFRIHERSGSRSYVAGVVSGVRGASIGVTLGADRIFAAPFYTGEPLPINRIAVKVATADAAGKIRLGLYDNGDRTLLTPGRRIKEFGEALTGSTGLLSLTISPKETITRGLKWLVLACNSGTLQLYNIPASDAWAVLGQLNTDPTVYSTGWLATYSYSTLPESFPSSGLVQVSNLPLIAVQATA